LFLSGIVKKFLISRWFLLVLAMTLVVGIAIAEPLEPLAKSAAVRNGLVAMVLFMMALPLEAGAMWRALRHPWPTLLAVAVNFGLLPLFAWGVSFGLSKELAPGMLVAAATPCSVASAAVWTRRAGGNDSVAILVTIITNLSCFFVTPLWVVIMTGQAVESDQLSLGRLVANLALIVVLPMTLAQLLRLYRPLAAWATEHRLGIGVGAQCGILSMIFIGAIQTGLRLRLQTGPSLLLMDVLVMIAAVIGVHLAMLGTGLWLARLFRISDQDRIAVGFAGSQKTLMVGLQVSMDLGYSILPMVVYHVGQLLVDTVIADRFRKHAERAKPAHQPDAPAREK
jgi:sodium/bile acid cotransporter 7